jgi:alpha-tubulin suppressor-like RCC1 family protein
MENFETVALPSDLAGVVAVSSCLNVAALTADGSIVCHCWGSPSASLFVPPADLRDVTAISCGSIHMADLTRDGKVVCWGSNGLGQCTVPYGLENVISVSCGGNHTAAVTRDGNIVCWGFKSCKAICDVPLDVRNVVAVSCGGAASAAVLEGVKWFAGESVSWMFRPM